MLVVHFEVSLSSFAWKLVRADFGQRRHFHRIFFSYINITTKKHDKMSAEWKGDLRNTVTDVFIDTYVRPYIY